MHKLQVFDLGGKDFLAGTSYDIIDEPPEDFMEPQSSLPRFDGWVSDDGWMFGISGDF